MCPVSTARNQKPHQGGPGEVNHKAAMKRRSHHLLVGFAYRRFDHPQQAPVGDFFTPAQPQHYQSLQIGGDGSHRQVRHVDAQGQVQLPEGVAEELGEGEHGKVLRREEKY